MAVIMDCYTKLNEAILTSKTNFMAAACIFHKHWVDMYGILSEILTRKLATRFEGLCDGVEYSLGEKYHYL